MSTVQLLGAALVAVLIIVVVVHAVTFEPQQRANPLPRRCIYCEPVRGVSEGVPTPVRDGDGDPICHKCHEALGLPKDFYE